MATMFMKFSVPSNTVKYASCSRKYLPYDNTMKCKSLLNSRIQYHRLPGLFQQLQWAGRKMDSIPFSYKRERKPLKLLHEPRILKTSHFNELPYQSAQLCPTFKK